MKLTRVNDRSRVRDFNGLINLIKAPSVIRIWMAILIILPIVAVIDWRYIYGVYFSAIFYFLLASKSITSIPKTLNLLVVKIVFLMVLMVFHGQSPQSVVNLGALLLVDFLLFLILIRSKKSGYFNVAYGWVFSFVLVALFFWFLISVVFSGALGIANPIFDLTRGARLRLLSVELSGHSILIDICFVGLIICTSKVVVINRWARRFWIVLFSFLLILSRSAAGWLLLAIAFFVLIVESTPFKSSARKNIVYAILVFGAVLIFSQIDVNSILMFIRSNIQGVDVDVYRGDYSAGRYDLNKLLLDGMAKNPFYGLGHDDPILRFGTRIGDSDGAVTESVLRVAVKYGVPYFIVIFLIASLPFRGLLLKTGGTRIFSISLGLGLYLLMATNGAFEVPHSWSYLFYFGLIFLSDFAVVSALKEQRRRAS